MRVDKWLWAARFFKTRTLASDAAEAGRVSVNGERAKPAKVLKPGDILLLRKPPYEYSLVIKALSDRRGPAKEAQLLYEESAASIAARQTLSAELRDMPPPLFKGRPTKRDRRAMEKFLADHTPEE
jgi:ribosome-associated heat shock protein Hsp15